ncbi:MAG TPA: molybdopterin oxidoreductase family protein [Pyrinomonadaceae bacterium]|nr:molybdopterin oxidoreductase family protein [Pyrinomonadaceae bacterium]
MNFKPTDTHYRSCNLCEAMCGIEISIRDDQTLDIRGDKNDPFSRGYICPKAVALQDIHNDKDRLRHPVRRTSDGWERVSWSEAFNDIERSIKSIQSKYGRNSVATYFGNPTVHSSGALLFGPAFIRSLRTRNRFSATSVDQLPHHLAAFLMFGHQLLLPVPDVDRTKFFLILGANPAVSNGSMMTAPDIRNRLRDIQARGGKVIVVDPRFTETARLADRHLFVRPGTDVFLLLALLHVILKEKLSDPGRLASFTDGVSSISETVREFSPEAVGPMTGMDPGEIRSLAAEFASAESAVCYGRIGLSTQAYGGVCQWLINVLNIVTGNLDHEGGSMFPLPAFDPITAPELLAPRGSHGRWHSRVRKLPESGGELPVAALADEILSPGEGQIRSLVTFAGNPVLSTPNGRKLDEAFASLDFMVSIDCYINETTRHANIILPTSSPLERDHYDIAFHLLAIRNTAKFSQALFQRSSDTLHDWEIFSELTSRLETGGGALGSIKRTFERQFLSPDRMLDLGLRFGPYGSKLNPFAGGLNLRKLKKAVHGIDLGPMKPCLPDRLRTGQKRIDLAPKLFVDDIARATSALKDFSTHQNGELLLIGRRQLRSNNSWMHNYGRLVRGEDRCTIMMNTADAAVRGLDSGQIAVVRAKAGSVTLPVEVSDELMPGVVSIPHGWGHGRTGVVLGVASEHAGESINDLTDDGAVDPLCGTAAFNGTKVLVEKATA